MNVLRAPVKKPGGGQIGSKSCKPEELHSEILEGGIGVMDRNMALIYE